MRRLPQAVFIVVLALASTATAAVAANLVPNGGFENPVVPAGGFSSFSTGASFGGWAVVGAAGNVSPVSTTFVFNGFAFPAKVGKQWLDLTGTTNTKTGVRRSVATTVGHHYTLTFWVGNVYNPGGSLGTSSTVNVAVNGTRILTAKNTLGQGSTKMVWKQFSVPITATRTSTSLTFTNGDPANDTANGLDAISLG